MKKSKNTKQKKSFPKKQVKEENKILRNFFVGILVFLFLIFVAWYINYSFTHLEYGGVKFKTIKEGDIILYNTQIPVIYKGEKTDYNFYLRTNPKELNKIRMEGELSILQNMVINETNDFSCEGKGLIAVANLAQLYQILGTKVIKDENAACDPEGKYAYVNLIQGTETYIEEISPSCYNIYIKDCEVLEGTERFMLETFIKVQDYI
jgi:hypothetical protein